MTSHCTGAVLMREESVTSYILVLQAPIVFCCHLSSDQPSVAVLSQLLAQRPGTPCQKIWIPVHFLPRAQNVAFQEVFFLTSSSDTDSILTFSCFFQLWDGSAVKIYHMRAHNRQLPNNSTHIIDCNFINRVLYCNSYSYLTIWTTVFCIMCYCILFHFIFWFYYHFAVLCILIPLILNQYCIDDVLLFCSFCVFLLVVVISGRDQLLSHWKTPWGRSVPLPHWCPSMSTNHIHK